ncbi:hypothetical protein [uncultured Psychroserpens sp.]|uniref:hypothetical protein n=1 Tax=uncultured Psychroserpens sp. TaxID=255436 RepID=UPI002627A2A8|nr:hypothetical protein [uncultured Psychroserpens sp.]
MYRKIEPKNKNITVRVTEKEHNEFNDIANSLDLSVSEWSNCILSKHKYDYDKKTRLEELILDREIEQSELELIKRVLEKFQIDDEQPINNRSNSFLNKLRLAIKILDMTSFKSDQYIDRLISNYRSYGHHPSI